MIKTKEFIFAMIYSAARKTKKILSHRANVESMIYKLDSFCIFNKKKKTCTSSVVKLKF